MTFHCPIHPACIEDDFHWTRVARSSFDHQLARRPSDLSLLGLGHDTAVRSFVLAHANGGCPRRRRVGYHAKIPSSGGGLSVELWVKCVNTPGYSGDTPPEDGFGNRWHIVQFSKLTNVAL